MPVFRLVEDMLTTREGWEGYRRGLTLVDGSVYGIERKEKKRENPKKPVNKGFFDFLDVIFLHM